MGKYREDDRFLLISKSTTTVDLYKEKLKQRKHYAYLDCQIITQSKTNVQAKLRGTFNERTYNVYLFYCGRAQPSGDWIINQNDRLTYEQLVNLWNAPQAQKTAKLYLFLDSDYAGKWCQRLEQDNRKLNIMIFASHGKEETKVQDQTDFSQCLFDAPAKFQETFKKISSNPVFFDKQRTNPTSKLLKYCLKQLNDGFFNAANSLGFYEGPTQNGMRQGKGKMVYPDSSWYNGQWNNDFQEGIGLFEGSHGTYYGQWKRGKSHGKGVYLLKNGFYYKGDWKEGEYMQDQLEKNFHFNLQAKPITQIHDS